MTTTTRGFSGRRRVQPEGNRVPPGQFVTDDFPVLSAGPTPRTQLEKWTLALQDGGSLAGRWTWEEFQSLPQTEITVDIHCVTKWSKLGTKWQGVTIDHLIEAADSTTRRRLISWPSAMAATPPTCRSRI